MRFECFECGKLQENAEEGTLIHAGYHQLGTNDGISLAIVCTECYSEIYEKADKEEKRNGKNRHTHTAR